MLDENHNLEGDLFFFKYIISLNYLEIKGFV